MPSLETIVGNLARAQREFLVAADGVPRAQWKHCPCEGHWSAGEVVAHLIQVERLVLQNADASLQKPPKAKTFFERWHFPMALVEARLIKRKSPVPLDPALVCQKEEMLGELRDVRERTLSFVEETRERDLSQYYRRHPFLGTLNLYQWFQMIASHQIRHTKQMKEIAETLQKSVATLQK